MKTSFRIISSLLIIILAVVLAFVLISYFNEPVNVENTFLDNISTTNHEVEKLIGEDSNIDSTISNISDEYSGEHSGEHSGEYVSGESKSGEQVDETNTVSQISTKANENKTFAEQITDKTNPVIITSEDSMTDKEKRQILTELDDTLMELLDAVEKVQTVDESRLITSESGVQN